MSNFNLHDNIGLLTLGLTSLLIFGMLKVAEFFLIIYAGIKTSNGEYFKYPITIPFIK
ncbi:putative Tic20 family protein [Flavobacterium sp. PL12]